MKEQDEYFVKCKDCGIILENGDETCPDCGGEQF